jgi:nucleoside-diphosphate-sugar epimerase
MEALHVEGAHRLIEAARHEIGRWVQLSSVGVYGQPRCGLVTEQSPMQPHGTYEITKEISDDLVRAAGLDGAFEWAMLRPSIVFGEGMPNRSLYQLIETVDGGRFFFIGRPGASANYIHVENVVHALIMCGAVPQAKGRIYNLSDCATLEQFVAMIAGALGKDAPKFRLPEMFARAIAKIGGAVSDRFPLTESRIDAMTTRVKYPIGAIRAELGYDHEVTLMQGVSRLVSSWRMQQNQPIQ